MKIEEGNILIAKFLGWEMAPSLNNPSDEDWNDDVWTPNWGDEIGSRAAINAPHQVGLFFHKSWDSLIPVVQKIESCGAMVHIYFGLATTCEIWCNISKDPHRIITEDNDSISGVWLACISFIIWYNEHKQ